MEEDFNNFIDERINHNYYKIRKDSKRKDATDSFDTIYHSLYKQLSQEQRIQLDDLICFHHTLTSLDSYLAYKIGVLDCLDFIYSHN